MSLTPSSKDHAIAALASEKLLDDSGLNRSAVLGRFEENLLMSALCCGPDATANAIKEHLEAKIGKRALTSVLVTLDRLSEKGYMESECEEEPSKRRGGRRRRLYKVTPTGRESVERSFRISAELALEAGLIKVA